MSQVCRKAADEFRDFALKREGGIGSLDRQTVLEYAFALVQKYGQAAGEVACKVYEEIAEAQGVIIPAAEMAPLPEFGEVAKAVNGAIKQSVLNAPGAVERLTKQVGADTMLLNAKRDGAYFAWVSHGDTCPYCLMMSAIGWQKAGKKTLKGGHAEHIHAHCDCQYVVDFKGNMNVEGYDPKGLQTQLLEYAEKNGVTYGGDFNAFLGENARNTTKKQPRGLNAFRRKKKTKEIEMRNKTNKRLKMNLQLFAQVPDGKLVGYALNSDHPVGKHKARVFKSVLGYDKNNYLDLKQKILENFDEKKLEYRGEDKHGKKYQQIMKITGPNGNTADVTTAWIKETEKSEPRMTSAYIEVK